MPVATPDFSPAFRQELANFDRMPPTARAFHIVGLLRRAQTPEDFHEASARWSAIKDKLRNIESDSCSSGDVDLGKDILDDLVKAPLDILVSAARVVLHFAAGEKDELVEALRDAFKAVTSEGADWLTSQAGKRLDAATAAARRRAVDRLREALIAYLRAWHRRSRRHYAVIVDRIFGLVRTGTRAAGSVVTAVRVMLTPSRIGHELCGLLAEGDRAHDEAFRRVMGTRLFPR